MAQPPAASDRASAVVNGATALGIELGSTRIKACLVALDGTSLAEGGHAWENQLVGGLWTYPMAAVEQGLQDCYSELVADCERRHGVRPATFGALGVSAMMHGYLPLDVGDELLVPFRTWRNTNTGPAAAELTELFECNVPLRWSVAHLYQAVLDAEPHVTAIASLTTLAGYVHRRLTGRSVLGVGDASGMFPIDPATRDYDDRFLGRLDARLAGRAGGRSARELLPEVLVAGQEAGRLTAAGAAWLDPSGALRPGVPLCPPEGDAGTGMVATNSVAPRTGNVSAGTSIFAMAVLERPFVAVHHEIDSVTTPAGDPVAMVHCNNGASELNSWAGLLSEFAAALGHPAAPDDVFGALFEAALDGEPDAGGLLAYNYLAGEPIAGLDAGRPLFVRTPESRLTLANFARAQLYGVFGTLALGMRVLTAEGVRLDGMFAHGGLFRTKGVAQRLLAAAIDVPVTVGSTAGEGGAWGIAVLAAYRHAVNGRAGFGVDGWARGIDPDLGGFLEEHIFAGAELTTTAPDPVDTAGFTAYLERYDAGLAAERAAVDAVRAPTDSLRPRTTDALEAHA